jgi:Glycosyl hydrolase family 20, catalytic domain
MTVKPHRLRFTLRVSKVWVCALVVFALELSGSAQRKSVEQGEAAQRWRGVHLLNYNNDADLERLAGDLPKLTEMGINFVILEVDYHFEFQSHPELRQGDKQITKAGSRKFAEACRRLGVRLIPEFQCVGHQSWAKETFPLLTKYPQFDLTPGAFPNNEGLYCREWDINNPEVYKIVFKLMDEIIDAFGADAFHIGADEVFLLGSDKSPSTKGQDPAKLYAKAINDVYDHLVKKRKVEMLMWGDRLIDANRFNWGEWEASKNGTAPAVDMIPKDIIICPWHYEPMEGGYPSIPMFIEKGFRVLPTSWNKPEAMKMLVEYSYKQNSPMMLGHLFTIWSRPRGPLPEYPPMVEGLKLLKALDGR